MPSQPTYEDANLILRLYELRREPKLRQAREWFAANFKASTMEEIQALCPPESEGDVYVRMVVGYWDMAASFVTRGVLNAELFYENSGELLFVWERLKDTVPQYREMMKAPHMLRNMEQVAEEMVKWHNKQAPEWYPAFRQMVRGAGGSQSSRAA